MVEAGTDIIKVIEESIKGDFYKQFSNDGNRFVAWYLKTIYSLSDDDVVNLLQMVKTISRSMRYMSMTKMNRYTSFKESIIQIAPFLLNH